jgi:hypothetical protein
MGGVMGSFIGGRVRVQNFTKLTIEPVREISAPCKIPSRRGTGGFNRRKGDAHSHFITVKVRFVKDSRVASDNRRDRQSAP